MSPILPLHLHQPRDGPLELKRPIASGVQRLRWRLRRGDQADLCLVERVYKRHETSRIVRAGAVEQIGERRQRGGRGVLVTEAVAVGVGPARLPAVAALVDARSPRPVRAQEEMGR